MATRPLGLSPESASGGEGLRDTGREIRRERGARQRKERLGRGDKGARRSGERGERGRGGSRPSAGAASPGGLFVLLISDHFAPPASPPCFEGGQ